MARNGKPGCEHALNQAARRTPALWLADLSELRPTRGIGQKPRKRVY